VLAPARPAGQNAGMTTWTEFTDQPPSRVKNLLMGALGHAVAFGLVFCFWLAVWLVAFAVLD